jgi:hypothetical protein
VTQRQEEPATGSIESNSPTSEPVTIPASICAAPAAAEVPTVEAEVPATLPLVEVLAPVQVVEPVSVDVPEVEPVSCPVEALAWMNARNAAADVEAKVSDEKAHKSRRKATVAAREMSRPVAVEQLDRAVAEAEAAIEEGKAWPARRAEAKEQ